MAAHLAETTILTFVVIIRRQPKLCNQCPDVVATRDKYNPFPPFGQVMRRAELSYGSLVGAIQYRNENLFLGLH